MTKSLLHIILFLLTVLPASAQTFAAMPNDSIEGTYHVNDWASDYIYLRNNSIAPVTLSYQTISNTMTPAGWDVVLCTNNACFPYVPTSGTLGTIASGDSGYFHLQCGFMGFAGTNQVRVRVYETSNPTNCDTITFLYHAMTSIGFADNSSEELGLSQNYPNPFSETTTIAYDLAGQTGELVVTDVSGKVIFVYKLNSPKGNITIGGFLPGIYFYALNNDAGMIARRTMIVQ
jgi:Secretion system C-terminal sorting domain